MATPELATEILTRKFKTAAPICKKTQGKRGQVVEFDPRGKASRRFEGTEFQPTGLAEPASFLYDGVRAGRAIRAGLSRRSAAVRPLPMEDVWFHVKRIDNSRCRRPVDPAEKVALRHLILWGFASVIVALAAFGPIAALRQSGYRLEQLAQQRQSLLEVNHQLKMKQAMLGDLRRITRLAETRGLASPSLEHYAWQHRMIAPRLDGHKMAQNRAQNPR